MRVRACVWGDYVWCCGAVFSNILKSSHAQHRPPRGRGYPRSRCRVTYTGEDRWKSSFMIYNSIRLFVVTVWRREDVRNTNNGDAMLRNTRGKAKKNNACVGGFFFCVWRRVEKTMAERRRFRVWFNSKRVFSPLPFGGTGARVRSSFVVLYRRCTWTKKNRLISTSVYKWRNEEYFFLGGRGGKGQRDSKFSRNNYMSTIFEFRRRVFENKVFL